MAAATKASRRKTGAGATVRARNKRRASTAASGLKARDVAVEILKKHGGPMSVKDLAAEVVKSGRTKLAGKTPHATVAAQIYVAAKKGELFKKTGQRGTIDLLERPAAKPTPKAKAAAAAAAVRSERPSEAAMREADEEASKAKASS